MALAEDILGLRDRALTDLATAHDYYTDTKMAWRIVQKVIQIDGADAHTLYVLDVTPGQWEAIQKGALPLPQGWALDGRQELGKR